jgi:cytochrome c biogenesis protein ResB
MKVASSLLTLLVVLTIVGACLPQLPSSVAQDPEPAAAWLAQAEERWGAATAILYRWGLFELFRSATYVGLVALLVLSTLSCTLTRWRAIWHRTFGERGVAANASREGTRQAIILPPLPLDTVQAALEGLGYRVRARQSGHTVRLQADRHRLSRLGTLGTHLAVLALISAFALTGWLGWHDTIELAPGQLTPVGHHTGLSVRNEGWAIDRYPDGSVAAYRARVAVLEEEGGLRRATIQVNRPLRLRGLGLYLMGFRETETGTTVALQVTHDPGKGLALAGAVLLCLGTTATIYLPHSRIVARLDSQGTRLTAESPLRADTADDLKLLTKELTGC